MTRVVIISPSFGGLGGMEASVLALGDGLVRCPGVELRVVFKATRGFAAQPAFAEALNSSACRPEVIARGSLDLLRVLAWADVVQVQNPCPDVIFPARLLRRPVLVNVINHRLPGQSLHQRLWDASLRLARERFYISNFVRETWEGPDTRPGSQIVYPICQLADGIIPPAARRGFVFAARWIANKGVETLVEAYALAGLDPVSWPLCLIGDGPLRADLLRLIETRGLRGITAPGFLSQEAKAEAIRTARFMVVPPNTREDFGLTAIEARHLGVPCIITRDGGLPEAAGPGAFVCEPGDVTGLAACLRAAATMLPADYATLAAETRRTLLPVLRHADFYADAYHRLAPRR